MRFAESGTLKSALGRRILAAPRIARTRAWFCRVTDFCERAEVERKMGYDSQYRITMDGDVKYFTVELKSACALIIRDDEFYLFSSK